MKMISTIWKRRARELFDKYTYVVDGLILLVFSAFVAAGINQLISARIEAFVAGLKTNLASDAKSSDKTGAKTKSSRLAAFTPTDGATILKRNFFDSLTGPLDGSGENLSDVLDHDGVSAGEDSNEEPYPPLKCSLNVPVVGLFASKDPEWSFAAIRQGRDIEIKSIGDKVQSHEVDSITWEYLFLVPEKGKHICYLDIWELEKKPKGPHAKKVAKGPRPRKKKKPGKKKSVLAQMMDSYIEDLSANEKNVDRRLMSYIIENKQVLTQSGGKIVPKIRNGVVEGYKVYNIRKMSLWGKLGIQNGDLIKSINGRPMTGPASALKVFKEFGSSDLITINIERKGKNMNLDLNIM